jgi:hypothetical protein
VKEQNINALRARTSVSLGPRFVSKSVPFLTPQTLEDTSRAWMLRADLLPQDGDGDDDVGDKNK